MVAMLAMIEVRRSMIVPDSRIQKLLEQADGGADDASIVSIEQTILGMLFSAGLAWAGRKIHSRHIGVHESNRYGFGVAWTRMHRLGQKIMRLGFSWNAASNVICVEGDQDQASCSFTLKLQASADEFGKQKA